MAQIKTLWSALLTIPQNLVMLAHDLPRQYLTPLDTGGKLHGAAFAVPPRRPCDHPRRPQSPLPKMRRSLWTG